MKHHAYENDSDTTQSRNSSDQQSDKKQLVLSIEDAMEQVGQRHKYQIIVTIASFIITFITTYGYMVIPYFLSVPEFECLLKGQWELCGESTGACDSSIQSRVRTEKDSTISEQFQLYCDKRSFRVVLESVPLFAGILGTLTFVYLSDRIGRRFSIQICWILATVSSFILNFANNVGLLMIGSFGLGFSGLILQILMIVQINELSNKSFRVMGIIGLFILWAVSEMQYIWMMAVLPNWKWNMFTFYTIPLAVLMVFTIRLFHDSPRYLYLKDKAKCIESLNRIAAFNKKNPVLDNQLAEYKPLSDYSYNYLDLLKYKSQRSITINMSLVFLFSNLLYQGSQEVLDTLGTSFGESSLYVGIGELIGQIISDYLASRVKRRKGIFYSLGSTSLIFILFVFFPLPSACVIEAESKCWEKPFSMLMVSFARALTSITSGFQILLCGEIYPASMKSLGIGFNLAMGYLGTFLAPFLIDLSNSLKIQPIVVIGVVSFVGNFCSLFQKESMNAVETMDIPELEELRSRSSSSNDSNKAYPEIKNEIVSNQNAKQTIEEDKSMDEDKISDSVKVQVKLLS